MTEVKAGYPEMPVSIPCPFSEELLKKVRYTCTCGVSSPLSRMYFCRHCFEIRCYYCVLHEVDSHYCPNCLENMPSAEARMKQNRCANCFDCPSCGHTLSTRATSDVPANPGETPRKVYYLSCVFCRWSSRDIGLSNQKVTSGGWPEKENPNTNRISVLLEHYRSIAQKDKLEKESKRQMGRKLNYLQLSDKYGLARKRAGLPPLPVGTSSDFDKSVPSVTPSTAVDIDELEAEESVNEQVSNADIYNVTNMLCRLSQTDTQPSHVKDIYPLHMHLVIKRSQRCRKCEHNLSKPEYNPTSIKFKIQLAAFYHVPDISIYSSKGPWKSGEETQFILKLVNPTQHATEIEFLDTAGVQEFRIIDEEMRKKQAEAKKAHSNTIGSLLRQQSLIKASDRHQVNETAKVVLPKGKIHLPPRDDAAEFDDSGPDLHKDDDKNVIAWRKGNKVGVLMTAIPDGSDDEIVVSFGLKFLYTNTISALDKKDVQTADIVIPVYVKLGKIC
ncbi:dynactin subunit 4 [Lepeophtheirus salmonis]|uniref:dynactin subunit 4 n=1 Tax=Lepeophtheirus salmonis TaxID=72036 RepID=UPI001AE5219D|nr:dynactin subunit 4-like [Lepeophtheirus salmonis]